MAAQRRAKTKTDHPMHDAARTKWASSGLSDDHARKLGLTPLTGEEVKAALGSEHPQAGGVLIPYFDLDGRRTDFFRVRYLEKLPGFAGVVEKPQRYVQKAGTLNEVYLPPIMEATWREVADDARIPIYITEGEFKAACGCAHGLATIGLGGVDVFRASKRGVELLPQLAEIKWENRNVVIVFDSDAATNPNVVRAQRSLAQLLVARGAFPAVASLPAGKDGSKQGMDDLLVAAGPESLIDCLKDAPAFPEAHALWELNEEVLYIRDPGIVIERESGQRMDPGRFQSHHYANRHYLSLEQTKQGATIAKRKPLAKRWIEWEHRAEAARVTYAPGQPPDVDGAHNVWPGWGCEPVKGDISTWVWLLDHCFQGRPRDRRWFEQWCAYPLQHPGVKMFTYVLLWSVEQGTGKSFISYALKGIYGRNGIEVGNDALRKGFNAWQENRQFVIGDEITAGEARLDADKLKRMICQPEIHINQKFLPEYRIPDCINYLFNSNHPDAMFLEDRDRRGFVHRLPDVRLSEEFRRTADGWLNSKPGVRDQKGPGPSHLFHHLLHLDLTGFDPSAPAPFTQAKEEMIMSGKSDVGLWVMHLKEDPTPLMRQSMGDQIATHCDLYTSAQLLRAYDKDQKGRVTEGGMGRTLSAAMVPKVNDGCTLHTKRGGVRLYAVRNAEKWLAASTKEIAAHYNRFFAP